MSKNNETPKKSAQCAIQNVSHRNFDSDDVIITEHKESLFYWEAKKYNQKVIKKASKKESVEYRKESEYWVKEGSENEAAENYGSSYGG